MVAPATSCSGIPRAAAIDSATSRVYAGSQRFPRNGTGARYGQSVSTMCFLRGSEFDQQSFHRRDPNIIVRDRVAQHRQPLIRRKEWLFLVVNRDRDNDFVKQRAGPFYDIEMTIRHRIKAAGINRAPHDQETFNALALAFN